MKDEDYIEHLLVASTHDTVLCFTSLGRAHWIKVYDLPQAGRGAKGKPLVNLLQLAEDEKVTAILPLRGYAEGQFVFMATADGTVKRIKLTEFSRPRSSGINAINLDGDNTLIGVAVTDGLQDIMLFSNQGKAIRFKETDVRAMGRGASGVRGMRLPLGARIVSMVATSEPSDLAEAEVIVLHPEAELSDDVVVEDVLDTEVDVVEETTEEAEEDDNEDLAALENQAQILIACANGYGKRTPVSKFTLRRRGGQGVVAIHTTERNGELVAAVSATQSNDLLLISDMGTMVRTRVGEVSVMSRSAQGVTLIRLSNEEQLVGVVSLEAPEEEEIVVVEAEATTEAISGETDNIASSQETETV
jgi:DNA gyrase subunit A